LDAVAGRKIYGEIQSYVGFVVEQFMADRQWYYSRGGQQQGPVNTPQLKQLLSSGQLQPTDLVWTDQMDNWAPANSVKGLFTGDGGVADPHAAEDASVESAGTEAAGVQYAQQFSAATQLAGTASREAAGALTTLISDPIGGLAPCFVKLGKIRALQVGVVFLAAFLVVMLLTVFLGGSSMLSLGGLSGSSKAKLFFQMLLKLVAAGGAMIGISALFRVMKKSSVGLEADLFTVGAGLLPLAVATFLGSILNTQSQIVAWIVHIVMAFAFVFSVLILYTGQSRIAQHSERLAAVAVGCMFAAAMLATEILSAALN
jgi:hypothetical protein